MLHLFCRDFSIQGRGIISCDLLHSSGVRLNCQNTLKVWHLINTWSGCSDYYEQWHNSQLMIQLSSSVFFILRSAVQTHSQYSTSEIATAVGGYQAHFVDGKTEARCDGAQQQSQTTQHGNFTRHSHGNSSLAAGMEESSSLTVPSQSCAVFWVCLEMLSYACSVQVLNLAGSCKHPWGWRFKHRKEQAGPLN